MSRSKAGPKSGQHHEALYEPEAALPSERSTGLVFAAVFAIVALIWRETTFVLAGAGTVSAAFVVVALVRPQLLGPLNRKWFAFALFLNRFVSPLIMGLVYVLAIVPFGMVFQLRADPLRQRRDPELDSYWIDRTTAAGDVEKASSMRDQF